MRSIVLSTVLLLGGAGSGTVVAASTAGSTSVAEARPSGELLLGRVWSGPFDPRGAAAPVGWQKWRGGWVRLEDDLNLSCLSRDGKNCFWNNEVPDPHAYDTSTLNPLVCGAAHQRQWGINGYNDDNKDHGLFHWCRSAYATLFARWVNYSGLGVKKWLAETPAGDVMCHSTDGKTCTEATAEATAPPKAREIHPLVCGAHYRRVFDRESYDAPGHWCRTPKIDEDFGQRDAKGDAWQDVKGNGWHASIEPAFLVRLDLPAGRSLALRTIAELKNEVVYKKQQPLKNAFFGFEFGQQVGFRLQDSEVVAQHSTWRTPQASHGKIMAAMTVTKDGNACFFVAPDSGERDTPFFAQKNFIGNTSRILDDNGQRIIFVGSPGFTPQDPGKSPSDWRANAGEDLVIDQVVALYDRHVPDEKNPGKKRFITYAEPCDKADALTVDW